MRVKVNNGIFEYSTVQEVENIIENSKLDVITNILISNQDKYPCLSISIIENQAIIQYFLNKNKYLTSKNKTVNNSYYIKCRNKEILTRDSLVSIQEAIECVKQFFDDKEKPGCIEWIEYN